MSFGTNLISLRESIGMTRNELADKLSIPYTTLRNYEKDQREPGHKLLIELSSIFSVPVDDLIGNPQKEEKMEFRIKEARESAGYSQKDLAELIGVAPSTFNGYENGNHDPKSVLLKKIAAACHVSVDYLLGVDDSRTASDGTKKASSVSDEAMMLAKDYDDLDNWGQVQVRSVANNELKRCRTEKGSSVEPKDDPAPQIEYIRHYFTAAAAGYVAPIEGEDYELVPRDDSTPALADFSINITGDSMEPYIHDGQRVFVQQRGDLQEFEVGIFFVDGNVFCKQWCVDFVGTLYLLSANPAREDANVIIPKDSGRSVVCFGKVLLPKKLPRPFYN